MKIIFTAVSGGLWRWLAPVLSGLLLAASFPPLEWGGAAWLALVPLLMALQLEGPAHSGRMGFLTGAVFWLISIHWLTRVTVAGWFTLALYCALYVALFALVLSFWLRRFGVSSWLANLGFMATAALSWAGFEYLRSVLFTGFPWNPLGASQHANLALIQIAAWGGVYAVSGVVVGLNAAVALTILRYLSSRRQGRRALYPEMIVALALLLAVFLAGARELKRPEPPSAPLRVALIQPNIPQDEKWDAAKIELIYTRLSELTRAALRAGRPDLIIWPETALPDDVRSSAPSYQLVYELATNGVPILLGSMDTAYPDDGHPLYYNSAFLFDGGGHIAQTYDKRHLVLFGEYIPWGGALSFINALTPIQESFTAGSTSTVFQLERPACAFSTLICFEDTVARLAREAVRNGARLLINLTNDAWFDPSSASRQHMIQCVFRCVENRVPGVRVANTGVTCCLDAKGRVTALLADVDGVTAVTGFKTAEVKVPLEQSPHTFYTRHGDRLAQAGAAWGLLMLAAMAFGKRGE